MCSVSSRRWAPLSECFHTKFITTSPIARIPGSTYVEFHPETAREKGRELVKMAIENYTKRDQAKIFVPTLKQPARVGYSCEAIIKELNGVTNSYVDIRDTYKPLIDCVKAGVIRGAVAIVGCNNPKVRPDYSHIEIMKKLLANDIIIVATGCAAQAAAKAGLMRKEAKELCGAGLKRVCELVGIPPVLHMGSCVDISRMMLLANGIAKGLGHLDSGSTRCRLRAGMDERKGRVYCQLCRCDRYRHLSRHRAAGQGLNPDDGAHHRGHAEDDRRRVCHQYEPRDAGPRP